MYIYIYINSYFEAHAWGLGSTCLAGLINLLLVREPIRLHPVATNNVISPAIITYKSHEPPFYLISFGPRSIGYNVQN